MYVCGQLSHSKLINLVSSWKMPHGSDDARKTFILTTTGNFYGINPPLFLTDSPEINNFLDDGNEFVLCVSRHDSDVHLSNKVTLMLNHRDKHFLTCTHKARAQVAMNNEYTYLFPFLLSLLILDRLKLQGTAKRRCWCFSSCIPRWSPKITFTGASWSHQCWNPPSIPSTRLSNRFLHLYY